MVLRALGICAVVIAVGAPGAQAVLPTGNLIINGGGETGTAATDSSAIFVPPGWVTTGEATLVAYGTSGFPDAPTGATIGGGKNFFAGGNVAVSTAAQSVNIAQAAPEIDRGGLAVTLSARIGGFDGQDDNATITSAMRNAAGATLATVRLAPVLSAARNGETTLLARSTSGTVPAGTRTILTTITITRTSGTYNDGYADNLSLTVGRAPEPQAGRSATAATVSGTVLVRRPGSSQFVELGALGSIPVGAIVDTAKGTVRMSVEIEGGKQRTGTFNGGQFKFSQPREKVGGKRKLTARLALRGGDFGACGARRRSADAGAARRRVVRFLKAKASGRFSVIGKYSKGIERGTSWTTSDGCDGTLTSVTSGTVAVFDLVRERTVVVRAGKSYLAKAR